MLPGPNIGRPVSHEQKRQFIAKHFDYAELWYLLTEIINYSWNLEVFAENNCFFTKWKSPGTKVLFNSVDNSSKSHRIRSKQVSFDSIRSALQDQIKNMHLSLKTQVLNRKTLFFRDFCQLSRAKVSFIAKLFEYAELMYSLPEITIYSWNPEVFSNMPNYNIFGTRLSIIVKSRRFRWKRQFSHQMEISRYKNFT